jgi:hypothetical protein
MRINSKNKVFKYDIFFLAKIMSDKNYSKSAVLGFIYYKNNTFKFKFEDIEGIEEFQTMLSAIFRF